jgi:hypothetical protein
MFSPSQKFGLAALAWTVQKEEIVPIEPGPEDQEHFLNEVFSFIRIIRIIRISWVLGLLGLFGLLGLLGLLG